MTILSDFFIATGEEYRAFDVATSPALSLPTVLGHGVDGVKVLYLESIVEGSFEEDPLQYERARIAWLGWEQYPCSLQLNRSLTWRLAEADDAEVEQWATAWASVEGWNAHGVTPERVAEMLKGIAWLARQTVGTCRGMYVWLCEGA